MNTEIDPYSGFVSSAHAGTPAYCRHITRVIHIHEVYVQTWPSDSKAMLAYKACVRVPVYIVHTNITDNMDSANILSGKMILQGKLKGR